MQIPTISFHELDKWLQRTPVIAEIHPLTPLALSQEIRIISEGDRLLRDLDNRNEYPQGPTLIVDNHPLLRERFPQFRVVEHPPVEVINRRMAYHLDYARQHLITSSMVGRHIERAVAHTQSDVVVLFLVDGLGYGDVLDWRCDQLAPCFVHGPSVTYRFRDDRDGSIVENVGFPAIIGRPSVFERLRSLGYRNARGYTYWSPGTNAIAEYMFSGIPFHRAPHFDAVMARLEAESIQPQMYIQIVRQGLDGLAHGRRELQQNEIDATIEAIRYDVERIIALLRQRVNSVTLFLTSDHGIAWKTQHTWRQLDGVSGRHSRFAMQPLPEDYCESAIRSACGEMEYYLLKMPFLASAIPYNDTGVHGGLSYQESIVPVMTLRR